jgi:hypothetical protein
MNYLKMVMHINVIVQVKNIYNQKKWIKLVKFMKNKTFRGGGQKKEKKKREVSRYLRRKKRGVWSKYLDVIRNSRNWL